MKLLEFTKRFSDDEACETHLKQGLSKDARIDSYLTRNMISKYIHKIALFLLLLTVGVMDVWGQTTDYSGTYYIGAVDHGNTPANNFYLCPTENWRYYDSENSPSYTSIPNGQPFLTTYKCRGTVGYDENNAKWIIEKHPTSNYYYIKHASDNKYLTYNAPVLSNIGRARVHLEDSPTNDDYALFAISYDSSKKAYNIISKYAEDNNNDSDNNGRKFLNVNKGNKQSLEGTNQETINGISTGGIIGLWTKGTTETDGTGKFYLEPPTPTITHNDNGTFTITAAEGATIYYTTNGSIPTTSSTQYAGPFEQSNATTIKAIAVSGGNSSSVASLALHTYTYCIVNKKGDIAIQYAVKQAEGKSLGTIEDIPADIRSSYLTNESASFYSFSEPYTSKAQLTDEVGISATPSSDAKIYVTYTTDYLSEKFLKLRGARAFNIRNQSGENAYDNGGTLAYEDANNTQLSHMWNIGGSQDPYDVEIKNIGTDHRYLVFSTPPTLDLAATATTKFIIMAGSAAGDGSTYEQVNLMAATGTDDYDFSKAEIKAYTVDLSFTYKLIDRQKKLLVTIENNETELKLPDEWISPLVSTYHFYKTASIDGDTYTLSNPVTSVFEVESGQPIYVNYDVSDKVDLDGRNSLNIEDKENKTYMLRFLNGESFYQEDGNDGIMTEMRKAIYPYNNGDVTLYVYGAEQWQAQLAKGASTRSRWLWCIEPANNPASKEELDPYHVKISSSQEHIFKENGVEIGRYPSYLRTYKPADYANVVTSVTNSNPVTNGGTKGGALDSSLATEYMIIGTESHTRLVTLNPVEGERRTVNSFEQYWKNNPTINGDASKDIPAVLTNKVTQEGRNVTLNSTQKAEIEAKGWHVYEKWALSAPWVNNGDAEETKSKQYWEEEHAFQTISMGSGNFVLEEVSLEPQVILLDNHGWELMRVPLSKTGVLGSYNSPMVEQYKWYSTSVKVFGYHKFDVIGTPYHTSTSLADVPTGAKVGNDFYVTYTVKPSYTYTYTGAAKAADTKATAFLLKQGGKYAKTSGLTIEKADAPESIDDASDDILWYLRPNFDIDREMGYRYQGETGAQDEAKTKNDTEQDYYIAGKNGFDPYNVQIQSKYNTARYFTANSSSIALSSGVWTGTSSQISLHSLNVKQHATGYDQTTLNITNATFMVVSDANGNMRLMPRFDHSKVANSDGESNPFTVLATQHAAATPGDNGTDTQTLWLEHKNAATEIHDPSEITDMNGHYVLAENFTFTGFTSLGTSEAPFTGTIDGQYHTYSDLKTPLVAYANGATIRNLMLDNVTISGGTNVGAICNEATGTTRIYNCGILATMSTASTDEDGYTHITNCSSSISGSNYVGGIVGLLDGESRVINCFSYANVSGGAEVGGIVGHNNVATTATNLKTMVMNCMFYGEVSGSSIAPIYNGEIITNVGESENTGVSNFNYFRLESDYIQDIEKAKVYNCALGAETRFLQRFEFFRHLQNSHRELAAWWATGDRAKKDEMAKWVLLPSQIGSSTPYPVLAKPGYYPSVVNIDAENAPDSISVGRNKGGKQGTLTVKIQMGDGAQFTRPTGAEIVYPSLTLNITDKDPDHFNFNYYKVQLPYYNDVGTKNYTGNRVVTGWKIVSIEGGTPGSFTTGEDAPAYNFADRKCTNKDLFSVSGRVFNQGAYWDVPYGVTAITIEPYWARCVYLADQNADKVYNTNMDGEFNVPNVGGGQIYTNGHSYSIAGNSQVVYTNIGKANATAALYENVNEATYKTRSVYDYAVVLVGNYHHHAGINENITAGTKPYTVTSVDLDGDNEPDYSFILRFNNRTQFHPVRYDFLNLIGLGMAQKSNGGTGSYNFGIMQPLGWFETTNTSLFRVTQFEYDRENRTAAPYIVQGGVIEQWVSGQSNKVANKTTYFHVGGNVWFKEFHRGTHQDYTYQSKHPPVSVTGGDYDEFYLTGLYLGNITSYADNAECYINGGRFGTVAGAAMEGLGKANGADDTGNITWQVQNADIREFYAGGINAAKPVTGNLSTTITGGKIDLFCGGPKFGDMSTGKTVVTNATGCTFGTFFGAGYGGNSYSRQAPYNHNNIMNFPHNTTQAGNHSSWNDWLDDYYTQEYNADYGGVSTQFGYQFLPMSGNADNCARIFVEYVKFSLATTRNVTSNLTGCTITGNFYGGGSLGKVDGPVTSTLDGCTVNGSVFGAGYSASLPTVEVDSIGFRVEPFYYKDLGTYRTGVKGQTTTYTWAHGNAISIDKVNKILYTTEDLTGLGAVTGNVTLNINGTTTVGKSVYGGGEESGVGGDTEVNVTSGTIGAENQGGVEYGNVYGGGKGKAGERDAGYVKGNTEINISQAEGKTTQIYHNVYGGGAYGSVGDFTYDASGMPTALNTAETGKTKVTITGGTFGWNGKENGLVFGSSRGDVAKPEGTPAVDPNDCMAWVYSTQVNIGTDGAITGPHIKGSVYGSGENGHTFQNTELNVFSGTIGITTGATITNDNGTPDDTSDDISYSGAYYPYRGNLYGGGCGTDTYWIDANENTAVDEGEEHYNPLAGIVRGATTVNIKGGQVVHHVYGAGAMGSVGNDDDATSGKTTINISGGRIGYDGNNNGNIFGAARGEYGISTVASNLARVRETEVNISYATTPADDNGEKTEKLITGSVFGGGEAGLVMGSVAVNMTGGLIMKDIYGGGALADTQTSNWNASANSNAGGWATGKTSASATTTIKLTGGTIMEEVFGGGLGESGTEQNPTGKPAYVYGDVLVELNNGVADDAKGCVVPGDIFGCNNLNGTPKGNVMVHIYKTQNIEASRITNAAASGETPAVEDAKETGRYDVHAVYGGGNQSAYEPADLTGVNKTEVIIDGCERTSIKQVYGGGNASSTPATNVTVNGTFEIEELFGGGNGKDNIKINGVTMPNPGANVGYKDYSEYYEEDGVWKVRDKAAYDTKEERMASTSDIVYGTGKASVNIYGGTIHRVFGGSNTKGNVRQTAVTLLDEGGECEFCVDEAYGGGKSAEMDAEAQLLLACIPGLQAVYGGAEAADVRGNVTLNITNGTFDRVFGGNNLSGTIGGAITINVEEIGCKPVLIGELYGGGNQAGYSVYGYNNDGTPKESGTTPLYDDPEVNVMSFTSIGNIYGGGYGSGATMVGNPTVNVNVAYGRYYDDDRSIIVNDSTIRNTYPIPSHAKGKMGAINNVFGGGNAAKVIGNTTVNIATLPDVYVVKQVTVGDNLTNCYTRNNDGTYTAATGTAVDGVTYYEKKVVLGADIRGDVYGGGNKAKVTGNTNVTIGEEK